MTMYSFFYKHPFLTFFVLMVSGLAFGAMTLNVFRLVAANWELITRYGLDAFREGALQQLMELILTGIISMMIYIIFKFCERILTDRIGSLSLSKKNKNSTLQQKG